MGVPVGGKDFEDAVLELENRDVECAPAQVPDLIRPWHELPESVGHVLQQQVGRTATDRIVDDAQAFDVERDHGDGGHERTGDGDGGAGELHRHGLLGYGLRDQ